MEEYDNEIDEEDEIESYAPEDVAKKAMLPSVKDPRLWQVGVKKGQERVATMSLMNKAIHFAQKNEPLSILSVTCSDNVDGFIYVEAFKEIHVREAIAKLSCIFQGKIIQVQPEEMPVVYQNEKAKATELKKHQWVRIKNGVYINDLGFVEYVGDDKAYIRLIPRLEPL